jgi:hypothetical protein
MMGYQYSSLQDCWYPSGFSPLFPCSVLVQRVERIGGHRVITSVIILSNKMADVNARAPSRLPPDQDFVARFLSDSTDRMVVSLSCRSKYSNFDVEGALILCVCLPSLLGTVT